MVEKFPVSIGDDFSPVTWRADGGKFYGEVGVRSPGEKGTLGIVVRVPASLVNGSSLFAEILASDIRRMAAKNPGAARLRVEVSVDETSAAAEQWTADDPWGVARKGIA
jgi:hypothetical protein